MTQAGESLGVVDLDGWVALGDQKPRESEHDGARLLGSYSGAELSLREIRPPLKRWGVLTNRIPRGGLRTTWRGRLTDTALDREGYSERQANRMRGVRQIAILTPQPRVVIQL